jgi:uncharacterized protein DUF11
VGVLQGGQVRSLRLAAVLVVTLAWLAGAGARPAFADASLSASANGPSELGPQVRGSFTITVSNSGDATAHGVQLSISFPNVPSNENNDGGSCPDPCLGNGHGSLVATIGDLAPGASLVFTLGFGTHGQGTLNHPWTLSSTDAGSVSGTYSLIVDAPPPPPPPKAMTTLSAAMTDAAKISGLKASQTVTIKNVGSNPALNAVFGVVLGDDTTVVSADPTAGTCTNANPIVVMCKLGSLAAGATVTLRLTVHLPVYHPDSDAYVEAYADNSPHVTANARAYFLDRFWSCICGSETFANGWVVPGLSAGYKLEADDTVELTQGFAITPDGVLHFPDGRTIVVDAAGHETFVPAPAGGKSSAPTAPKASAGSLQLRTQAKVVGAPEVGSSLRVSAAVWNEHPSRVRFQWQVWTASGVCRAIAKPSPTLKLTRALVGKRVRVSETAWFGGKRRQTVSRAVLVRAR